MSIGNRIRTVYLSQIKALKDHFERLDLGLDSEYDEDISTSNARRELRDSLQPGATVTNPSMQTPVMNIPAANKQSQPSPPLRIAEPDPMMIHYKVLGVPRNADISVIKDAWMSLRQRCDPSRFPEGSEERVTAQNLQNRVDESWKAIRDSLDNQSGRFDKLEI
jgi:hypothetical protein